MHLIQDLKAHLADVGPAVQQHRHETGEAGRDVATIAMVGEVIHDDTLWACRTCGACMQECPVMIEHVPTIVDMRRFLVMNEARIPATAQGALENLEDPYGPRHCRGEVAGLSAHGTRKCDGAAARRARSRTTAPPAGART